MTTIDWEAAREETRVRIVQSWKAGYASGRRELMARVAGIGLLFLCAGAAIGVVLTLIVVGWLA